MISPYSLSSENLKSSQNDLYGWNHKAKEPHHWGLSKNVILPTQWCVKNSILKNGWFWGQGIPRPTSSCHQGGSVKHAGALSDGFEIQVIPSWTKNHFSGSAKTKNEFVSFNHRHLLFFMALDLLWIAVVILHVSRCHSKDGTCWRNAPKRAGSEFSETGKGWETVAQDEGTWWSSHDSCNE